VASQQTSPEDIQTIIASIQDDPAFRSRLLSDPESALDSIGVQSNDEILDALRGLDETSLEEMAGSFGSDNAAC
jgi:hypothetical protein